MSLEELDTSLPYGDSDDESAPPPLDSPEGLRELLPLVEVALTEGEPYPVARQLLAVLATIGAVEFGFRGEAAARLVDLVTAHAGSLDGRPILRAEYESYLGTLRDLRAQVGK